MVFPSLNVIAHSFKRSNFITHDVVLCQRAERKVTGCNLKYLSGIIQKKIYDLRLFIKHQQYAHAVTCGLDHRNCAHCVSRCIASTTLSRSIRSPKQCRGPSYNCSNGGNVGVASRKRVFTANRTLLPQSTLSRVYSAHQGRKSNDNGGDYTNIALCSAVLASSISQQDEDNVDMDDVESISSEEMESAIEELKQALQSHTTGTDYSSSSQHNSDGWDLEWAGPAVTIWSRPIEDKEYRQYKVHGRYNDIPAVAFFYIQVSTSTRKTWDSSTDEIIQLESRKAGPAEAAERVYWRVNFPRPLAKRDYVFARRHLVDLGRNTLITVNRAVVHPAYPSDKKYVRVTDYNSKMLVQPHSTFTENGFDYVMTYFDDTKTRMPDYALKKVVRNGLPRFLTSVCKESEVVMSEYRKLKLTGSDITNCSDIRVLELHNLIEQAYFRQQMETEKQVERDTKEEIGRRKGCGSEHSDPSLTPTLLTDGHIEPVLLAKPVLIRKICPPSHLPDISRYLHSIFHQKKFTPIPLKKVHPDCGDHFRGNNYDLKD